MLRRISKYLLLLAAAALVLVLAAAAWLLFSESGARWSIARVEGLTDGAIRISGVDGTLASGIRFSELVYSDPGMELRASNASLRVDLGPLMAREVRVDHLDIEEISYLGKDGPETNPGSDGSFSLPVSLFVPEARLERFVVRGDTDEVIEQIRLAADWEQGDTIDVGSVTGQIRDIEIDASGQLVLASEFHIDVYANWSLVLDDFELEGRGSARGALSGLNIQHELLQPYPVHTEGTLSLVGEPVARLANTSAQINFDAAGEPLILRNTVLGVDGWIEQYEARWESDVAYADLPVANATGFGTGNLDAMKIDSAEMEMDGSKVLLSGEIEWLPALRWRTDVIVENLNPALAAPEWPGILGGKLSVAGSYTEEPGLLIDITDLELGGELRGQPLSVRGSVSKSPTEWQVPRLRVSSGGNHVAVGGEYGQRLNINYDMQVTNLTPFGEGWSGSVVGTGRVGGTLAEPNIETDLTIADLNLAGVAIANATARGRLASTGPASDLLIQANGVRIGEQTIVSLRTEFHGILENHRLSAAIDTGELSVDADFRGAWADSVWSGDLLDSDIGLGRFGPWRQIEPASLSMSQARIQAGQLCWRQDGAVACVEGHAAREAINIDARLEEMPFDRFAYLLPGGISIRGTANANAAIRGSETAPSLSYTANADTIDLTYDFDPGKDLIETSISDLRVSGNADPHRIDLDMSLSSSRQGQFALNGQLSDWQLASRSIDASLKASLPDASFLAVLTTEATNFEASLEADLSLQGKLAAPTMRGSVILSDARADIARAGITLEDIHVEARPAGLHRIAIMARARSGDGQIEADGHLDLDAAAGWPVTASIKGDGFQVLDLPGFDVAVSPDLQVTGSGDTLRLSGKVATPRAIIELRKLPEQAVELSPDVTVYRTEAAAQLRRSVLKVYADLDLELGKEVSFSGFGLTTQLAGGLAIQSEPGRVTQGRGIVDITSGKFEAYGQELDISHGRLIFGGALDNPTLDVEATRKVEDVTVGLQVSGSSDEPIVSVFSDPPMSETDALSYLVAGRSLSETSAAEGSNVASTAAALGLKQVMAATSGLGEAVGLDEFGLDTDSTDAGAIMAGKQINSDLHLRYSYGVFNRIGALLLRYRLNNRLSLEARSAEDQSMDLIYSHQKK